MIVFSLELLRTVQRRFSFQIKSPLTARTALQGGYKVSLAAGCPCGGQAPFRPIWLCGTGFHRLCLYLYLHPFPRVMHRFSVDVCCLRRYAKGAYRTSLHGRTKSPASALSGLSYLKCTPLQAALSTVFPVKGGNSRSAQAAMNKVYKNFVFSPFNLLLDGIYFPHHRKG